MSDLPLVREVSTRRHQIARKFYTCTICGTTIAHGDRYARIVMVNLDAPATAKRGFTTVRHHEVCPPKREAGQ